MASRIREILKGFHTVTPALIVNDASRASDFYKRAFGAEELLRVDGPDGKVGLKLRSATRSSCCLTRCHRAPVAHRRP